MHAMASLHELGSCWNQSSYLEGLISSTETINGGNSIISSTRSSTAETKALAARKSHSEAERRRRKRINGHLATLRALLPNTVKPDKASLLAEVVKRVGELKKTVSELAARDGGACSSSAEKCVVFPGEADELRVDFCEGGSGAVKASLCCEDRAGLVSDLTRALRTVRGKVVRAEMATVGGRTKSVVWVQGLGVGVGGGGDGSSDDGGGRCDADGMETLRMALKVVIDKPALSSGAGHALPGHKRPHLGPR